MERFIFCALVCTSAWLFCSAWASRPQLNQIQQGGHLSRVTPSFIWNTSERRQGWPLAGTIITRDIQSLSDGSHGNEPYALSNSMTTSDNIKDRSPRLTIAGITSVNSETKKQNSQQNLRQFPLNRNNLLNTREKSYLKNQGETFSAPHSSNPFTQPAFHEYETAGLRSSDAGKRHMYNKVSELDSVTPGDNASGMRETGRPEMKSVQEMTVSVDGHVPKGEHTLESESERNKSNIPRRFLENILHMLASFTNLFQRSETLVGLSNRVRRSSENEVAGNHTKTVVSPNPDSNLAHYAGNNNITILSFDALSDDDNSDGNGSLAGPTGMNTRGQMNVSVSVNDNELSERSNYSSVTGLNSTVGGDVETAGGQSITDLNYTAGETRTAPGTVSDPGGNEITSDPVSGAKDVSNDPLITPSLPVSVASTKSAHDGNRYDTVTQLQTKTDSADMQSSGDRTTPTITHPVNTAGTHNTEDTIGQSSSAKSTDQGTPKWSIKSDSVSATKLSGDVSGSKTMITTPFGASKHGDPVQDVTTPSGPSMGSVLSPTSMGDNSNNSSNDSIDGKTLPETESSPEVPAAEPESGNPGLVADPETTGEGNANSVPEPQPEPETEPEPETTDSFFPSPEPGPVWELAKAKWSYAWEIHIYTFGILFGLLALYTLLSIIRLWRIQRLLSKGYFLSLSSLMLVLCGTRSFYLLYDGYNSEGTYHISLDYFLYSIAFPCLTSAFSILLYALLKATNMRLVSPSVQKVQVLIFIIVVHFLISVATDVLIGFYAGTQVMLFVCQVYFILWGLFLFFSYAYIFRKLYSHALKRQKAIAYTTPPRAYSAHKKVTSKFTLSAAIKVTFFTAICGLVTIGLEIYAIVGVYYTFTRDRPKPWPWWLYHTVLRLIEFLMSLTMSYVASQPFRYIKSENKSSCGILCAPCSEILCCGSSINKSNGPGGWDDFEQDTQAIALHNENGGSLTAGSTKKLFLNEPTDAIPVVDVQPASESRPNSLLIIEDGYVRFHTEHDINRIVDAQRTENNIHNMNTFPLRDGFVNTGYSYKPGESKLVSKTNATVEDTTDAKDTSRKASLTSSDFFRVPSSVSLADSMENEIVKAFESFKLDTSVEEEPGEKSVDFIVVSDIENLKETDLISVDSLPGAESADKSGPQEQSKHPQNGDPAQPNYSPGRRAFTLLRRAKSSDVSENKQDVPSPEDSPYLQQRLYRSCSDHSTRSGSKDSANVKYSCLLDMDTKENRVLNSEGHDLDNDLDFVNHGRRPSEGQGNQAAILTSLLKSRDSGSNDNIEV